MIRTFLRFLVLMQLFTPASGYGAINWCENEFLSEDYKFARPHFGDMQYPIKARIWNRPEIKDALERELTPLNLMNSSDPAHQPQILQRISGIPGRLRYLELPGMFSVETIDVRIPYARNRHSEIEYVDIRITKPKKSYLGQKFPTILNLPTLHGWLDAFDGRLGVQLARQGYIFASPLNVDLNFDLDPSTGRPPARELDMMARDETLRARTALNYLETLDEVNAEKLGLLGFSRGSVAGSLLLGLEHDRIEAAYFGGGGLGLAEIFAESKTELGSSIKEFYLSYSPNDSLNTDEDYQRYLHNSLRYEALLWAHRVDPEKVKLMIIEDDTNVPTGNQYLMWEAFGRPDHIVKNNGHVPSIMRQVYGGWIPFNGRGGVDYINFFNERLKSEVDEE